MPKLSKMRFKLFTILCFLALNACTIKPPDVYVFEPLDQHQYVDPGTDHIFLEPSPTCVAKINEPACGHGVSIMSGQDLYVGEKTLYKGKKWSELRAEAVLLPAVESYAPLEAYIINACKKMNCDKQVDSFKVKLDELNGVSAATKSP